MTESQIVQCCENSVCKCTFGPQSYPGRMGDLRWQCSNRDIITRYTNLPSLLCVILLFLVWIRITQSFELITGFFYFKNYIIFSVISLKFTTFYTYRLNFVLAIFTVSLFYPTFKTLTILLP